MCNYHLILPVCPTCIRIRRDGAVIDPLIADPTPVVVCAKALESQRLCHFNDLDNPENPVFQCVIGSEQCNMCEQAQSQQYLPSASRREMIDSGFTEEMNDLENSEWPGTKRSIQRAGSQGHLLKIIWQRQLRKRQTMETGAPSLIATPISPHVDEKKIPEIPAVEFPSGRKHRKEKQREYFQNLYGASAYTTDLPHSVMTMNVTMQEVELQISRWAETIGLSVQVQRVAQELFQNFYWQGKRYPHGSGILALAACVGLASERGGSDLSTMTQLVSHEDLNGLKYVYDRLKVAWIATQENKPSALKKANSELRVRSGQQVHFRGLELGDFFNITPPESPADKRSAFVLTMEEVFEIPEGSSNMVLDCLLRNTLKDRSLQTTSETSPMPIITGLRISDLAQLPAAVLHNPRTFQPLEASLRRAFGGRSRLLRQYEKVTKPKFPEAKWYRADAFQNASYLLDERATCLEVMKLGVYPPLRLEYMEQLFQRDGDALAGHIHVAVDLQKRVKNGGTNSDVVLYLAHLLAISYEIGIHALKEIVESDIAHEIVPTEREWRIVRKNSQPSMIEPHAAQMEDASSVQVQKKVAKFYQHWTNKWIETARRLEAHAPVRDITRDVMPLPAFDDRKRAFGEDGDSSASIRRTSKRSKGTPII